MERTQSRRWQPIDVNSDHMSRRSLMKWATAMGLSMPALAGLQELAGAQTPGADTGMLVAPEPNPKRGGTLRTAFGITTTSYDIHQGANAAVLTHLYDGLVRFNPLDGLQTIIPSLATSWETSDDGLTYTFALRDGVTFHDGGSFSADDVVATFTRIIDPPEGMISVMRAFFRSVERIEAVDLLTVQFTLSEPQADLMTALAAPFSVIYSKNTLDENNQDLRAVVAPGTGPFVFDNYQEGERWVFTRNPNYWNPELPYVDQMELIHVAAWSDRGTAVLTGQADFHGMFLARHSTKGRTTTTSTGKRFPVLAPTRCSSIPPASRFLTLGYAGPCFSCSIGRHCATRFEIRRRSRSAGGLRRPARSPWRPMRSPSFPATEPTRT
ncbi:MAG: hypothetical protein KC438_09255, partial [Thermomicrobiales bacterium]|nr:hypothetical protein [Thermomicrobiales bacterium]